MHTRVIICTALLGTICGSTSDLLIDISGHPGSGGNAVPNGTPFSITCLCSEYPCSISVNRRGSNQDFIEVELQLNSASAVVYNSVLMRDDHMAHFRCVGLDGDGNEIGRSSDIFYRVIWFTETLQFTQTPNTTAFIEGEVVQFECYAGEAHPPAEIRWSLGNQEMTSSSNFTISTSEIRVFNDAAEKRSRVTAKITRNFNGLELECFVVQAGNRLSNSSRTFEVNFPPQQVSLTLDNDTPTEGQSVTIACTSDSSNPASTLTLKLGQPSNSDIQGFSADGEFNAYAIGVEHRITTTRSMNNMQISCMVKYNGSDVLNDSKQLVVYYPHNVALYRDSQSMLREGDSLVFTCAATDGNPPAVTGYTWTVCKKYVKLPGKEECSDSHTSTNTYTVNDISYTASGDYTCKALNAGGVGTSSTVPVQVYHAPKYIISSHKDTAHNGDKVKLEISVWAYPHDNVMFLWKYPDGKQVTSQARVGEHEIIISSLEVKVKQFGKYRCTINNTIGSYQHDFEINEDKGISKESLIPIIAGSVGGGLLLIIIVAVICVVIVRRKHRQKEQTRYEGVADGVCCTCCVNPAQPTRHQSRPPGRSTLHKVEHDAQEANSTDTNPPPRSLRYSPDPTANTGFFAALQNIILRPKSREACDGLEMSEEPHQVQSATLPATYINVSQKSKKQTRSKSQSSYENHAIGSQSYENCDVDLNNNKRLASNANVKKKQKLHTDSFSDIWTVTVQGSRVLKSGTYYMKCLKAKTTERVRLQVMAEIRALSQIEKHINLVELVAFQESTKDICIIMLPYKYGTLQTFLFQHRITEYFKAGHIVSFAQDIAHAMVHVHSQEPVCLHPNLNLEQVFVSQTDEGLVCKVTGFLAKSDIPAREQLKWETNTMEVHRPPEIQSKGDHSEKTDVWDFGMTLYQLLTLGELPLLGDTDDDTRQFIKIGNTIPIPEPCSHQMQILVSDCLSPKQFKRPEFDAIVHNLSRMYTNSEEHVDIEKAQSNLNYENPNVIADIATRASKVH